MNQSHTPILNQASWGSIQLGWGGTIVVFSQNNGFGIQLDIYIISYWVWCIIYIFGTSMYWCRSLARPTEPNWRWKIWNHVKADEYGCDNRMWKLCRSWPSFLQTIRCANCEVPLCNRKACWRHHVHAPLARSKYPCTSNCPMVSPMFLV